MADPTNTELAVTIVAKIDQLAGGLNQATSQIKNAVDQINSNLLNFKKQSQSSSDSTKDNFKGLGTTVKGFAEDLSFALRGGEFLIFEEVARQALDAVEKAFDQTIGKLLEFQLQLNEMSKILGEPSDKIAGLDLALKAVGISSEEYSQTSLRMQQRLRTQKEIFEAFIPALKGQNTELMSSQDIMKAAIDRFNQLADGTQKAQFALQIFGRQVQDIYKISEVTDPLIEHMNQSLRDFGIDTTPQATKNAQELAIRTKELTISMDLMWASIGQKLLPVFEKLIDLMIGDGNEGFLKLEAAITAVGYGVRYLVEYWYDLLNAAYSLFVLDWDGFFTKLEDGFKNLTTNAAAFRDELLKIILPDSSIFTGDVPAPIDSPKSKDKDDPTGGAKNPDLEAIALEQKLQDIRIQDALKLKQLQIQGDQAVNDYKLASGKEAIDEWVAYTKQGAEDAKNAQLSAINQEIALEKKSLDKDAPAKVKQLQDQKLQVIEQYQQAVTAATQRGEQQRTQMDELATQNQIANDDAALQDVLANLDEDYNNSKITLEDKVTEQKKLTKAVYEAARDQLDLWIAFYHGDTAMQAKYIQQKIALERAYGVQTKKLDNQITSQSVQRFHQAFQTISQGFSTAIQGMIEGTMTWKQALGQIINSVLEAFLNMFEEMLAQYIETQLAQAIFGKSTSISTAAGEIASNAAVAASGAYAAIAAIPYVGPALAPGAAMTAYAGALAWGAGLGAGFAEKGAYLDKGDSLIQAHKGELILPAGISSGLLKLIQGNVDTSNIDASGHAGLGRQVRKGFERASSGGGGGASANITFAPSVHALDGKSVVKTMKNPMTLRQMAKAYGKYMTKNPSSRGRY